MLPDENGQTEQGCGGPCCFHRMLDCSPIYCIVNSLAFRVLHQTNNDALYTIHPNLFLERCTRSLFGADGQYVSRQGVIHPRTCRRTSHVLGIRWTTAERVAAGILCTQPNLWNQTGRRVVRTRNLLCLSERTSADISMQSKPCSFCAQRETRIGMVARRLDTPPRATPIVAVVVVFERATFFSG